jgi:hypothetical protein
MQIVCLCCIHAAAKNELVIRIYCAFPLPPASLVCLHSCALRACWAKQFNAIHKTTQEARNKKLVASIARRRRCAHSREEKVGWGGLVRRFPALAAVVVHVPRRIPTIHSRSDIFSKHLRIPWSERKAETVKYRVQSAVASSEVKWKEKQRKMLSAAWNGKQRSRKASKQWKVYYRELTFDFGRN